MTIETDCDNPRVVSLTKVNHSLVGCSLGPVEERRRRLKKRPTQGKLRAVFLDGLFLCSHSLILFLHHPSANFAIANRLVRSVWLTC